MLLLTLKHHYNLLYNQSHFLLTVSYDINTWRWDFLNLTVLTAGIKCLEIVLFYSCRNIIVTMTLRLKLNHLKTKKNIIQCSVYSLSFGEIVDC